jgi:hypothetical protein
MRLYEILDATERFEIWQLITSSVNNALGKHAKTNKLKPIKPAKIPLPAKPKKVAQPKRKQPEPFNKPPRTKQQLAAIKPKPPTPTTHFGSKK